MFLITLALLCCVPSFARGVLLSNNGFSPALWGNDHVSNYHYPITAQTPDGHKFAAVEAGFSTAYFTIDLGASYNVCDVQVYMAHVFENHTIPAITVQYAVDGATDSTWNAHVIGSTSVSNITLDRDPGKRYPLYPANNTCAKNVRYIRIIANTEGRPGAFNIYAINVFRRYNENDEGGIFYSSWGESGTELTLEAGTTQDKACNWKGGQQPPTISAGGEAYISCSMGVRDLGGGITQDTLIISALAYTDKAYTISVQRKESLEYDAFTYTLKVKVSRKATTITMANASYTYDGTQRTISATTDSNGTLSITHYLEDGTTKTNFLNSGTNEEGGAPTFAGVYKIKAYVEATAQYSEKTVTKTLTIKKANRTLTLSKGASSDEPHVLTYPSSSSFTVTTTSAKEPGEVTMPATSYATFAIKEQSYTYTENFDSVANGSLPSGYKYLVKETDGTATVQNGALEISAMENETARHLVKLSAQNLLSSDFVFEADVTILEAMDNARWASLAYSLQAERHLTYTQFAVRRKASAASGVEYAHWEGGPSWVVYQKTAYSQDITLNKSYHLKVEGSGNTIRQYLDGTLMLEITDHFYPAGCFGVSVAGCRARFDNISISGTSATRTKITTTPTAATNGVQTATVTMAETKNYNAATATYYYQIDKGTITYTASDYEGTYDGAAHGITVSVSSPDNTTVKYGVSSGAITSGSNLLYTDAGTFTEYFTIEKANYNTITGSKTVTIKKKTITPTPVAFPKTYDGTMVGDGRIDLTGIVGTDEVAASATFTFAGKNKGDNITVTVSNITLSGAKAGNYVLSTTSGTSKANITAKDLTIKANNQAITYGGNIAQGVGQVTVTGLVSGDTLKAVTLTADRTDAGTGNILPSNANIGDSVGDNMTTNYHITYQNGVLTIARLGVKKPTVVTGLVYNGGEQAGVNPNSAATGYSYSGATKATNAASYTATATLDNNHQWSDGTTNALTLSWSIGKKPITITANPQTITYGNAIATDVSQVTVQVLANGDSLNAITLKAGGTNAGTTTITPSGAKIQEGNTDVTGNYTISYQNGVLTIDPKAITPVLTAEDRLYNGSIEAKGIISLPEKVGNDDVSAGYEKCSFDSPLVGTRTATATGISLKGAAANNYTLNSTSATDTANITKAKLTLSVVSPLVNVVQSDLIQTEITQNATMQGITLPQSFSLTNQNGSFGSLTGGTYTRTGIYYNALGVIEEEIYPDIVIASVPCVDVTLHVTTGQNAVFGDNTTEYGEATGITNYTAQGDAWQIENKTRKIATNAPATASINVYLRQGEHLLVDTAIGMYYGRLDVKVQKHGEDVSLAEDKIDAFFPVNYADDFRVSKLNEATRSDKLTDRGDYWNEVVPFTAPTDGVYTFTFTVTGTSYLHSVDERYTQNMPAMKPVTEITKFTINGTEMHGIDA